MGRTADWIWYLQWIKWFIPTLLKAFIDPIFFLWYYGDSKWEDEKTGQNWHIHKAACLFALDSASSLALWLIFKRKQYAEKKEDDARQDAENVAHLTETVESLSHVKSPTTNNELFR